MQLLQVGNFGERERTIADLARWMYLKGYDCRHFLTMSTPIAASEVVLRGYFCLRSRLDEEYRNRIESEASLSVRDKVGQHVRYMSMATLASAIACACNVGKVAIYHGNPLAINYAMWLKFVKDILGWYQAQLQSPSVLLRRRLANNLDYIQGRWPADLLADDGFPELIVA